MANEKKIERTACRIAAASGWKVKKIVTPGRRGSFDRLFIKEGRHVWIEFKDPAGKPSKLQLVEYGDLIAHGAEAHFCDNLEDAREILGLAA